MRSKASDLGGGLGAVTLGLSLPLEMALAALLTTLPAHACAVIAILIAVVVVETAFIVFEHKGHGGK